MKIARLRAGHPRIRFTAEELQERRAFCQQERLDGLGVSPRERFRLMLAEADAMVAEEAFTLTYDVSGEVFAPTHTLPLRQPPPLPQPRGFTDYPFWTRLSREVERRMTTLAMAYSLTGNVTYGAKAKDYLLALVEWRDWWEYGKPTNNLSLPHFTNGAAITYDEIWDLLTDEERARVRQGIRDLGLCPMSYWFDRRLDHNISVLMNVGMLAGYLAIGDDLPDLEQYFAHPMADLRWYVARREADATTEGLLYTGYAMGTLLTIASQVRRATGDDSLLRSPYITSTLPELFAYFRGGDGGFANLSDARHEFAGGQVMVHLINEEAHPLAAWLVNRELRDEPSVAQLTRDAPVSSPAELRLPTSKVFPEIGWAALRSGWTDDDVLLAFTSSASAAGHNHFDQNHFILNVAGEWLLTDPGYQNYTPGPENVFTNATEGHNALLINGEGQSVKGGGRIVRASLGPDGDIVVGDATAAYQGRVKRWVRHVHFVKPWYVLLVDEVVPADSTDDVELLFHTRSDVTYDERSLGVGKVIEAGNGTEFEVGGEQASVRISPIFPDRQRVTLATYPGAESYGVYLRMQPAAADRHLIVTLLQPRRPGAENGRVNARARTIHGRLWIEVERGRDRDTYGFDLEDVGDA